MKPGTQTMLCDSQLLKARDVHLGRLEALFVGKVLDHPFVLQGINGVASVDPYLDPKGWVDEALDSLADQADRLKDADVFRPLCLQFWPHGVHFAEGVFGARVHPVADGSDIWWTDRLDSRPGELQPPDLEADETWRLARAIAEAFLARNVTVPLFGLPTIAGSLNIVVNLFGEDALVAMFTDPEAVRHDLRVINDLLCHMYRWYLERIPAQQLQSEWPAGRCQPPHHSQIYGCTSQLISPKLYRDLIAPFDDELLSVYPNGGMIHLCGKHTQHIPTWRNMKSLRAVQLNDRASEHLELYFDGLRDDQIIYLHPTETMTVERALEITGGERVVIFADTTEGLPTVNHQLSR